MNQERRLPIRCFFFNWRLAKDLNKKIAACLKVINGGKYWHFRLKSQILGGGRNKLKWLSFPK